jgi:YidC/Oxa1 family membrane protein insertase
MKANKINKSKLMIIIAVIILLLVLTGCAKTDYMDKPLGDGFGFWDIFVYPMAGVMWLVGNSVGFHNYAVTIIIATLVVRTLAWPIYAKTNDMQLKMKIVQPELDKIQQKYAGRDDQESKQRMQLEQMQLYKKYGIGFGGCLMPLIQMPIFLGFYYTIRKIPACMKIEGHWLNIFNETKIFGVDMLLSRTDPAATKAQNIGIIVLAVLVGVTQVISILLSNRRQKKAKENSVSDVPEYRRPKQTEQQKSSEGMMKIMMYVMAGMMVVFVWQSPAALGLYWVVGNLYTTLQSWVGEKRSGQRLEKLRKKVNGR